MNAAIRLASAQRGGTLVGFVVGLLVGLGVALSVAIYVTRVPVPFVDRGVSRKPSQDIEEAERNKGWNPNAQLAGTPAPLPTRATAETATDSTADSATPTASTGTPTATAAAKTTTAAAPKPADPLGDLVNAKLGTPAAAGAPAAAEADPFTYFVQAGAFRTPEDAEAQRAKLAMMGMAADVSEREQSGRTVFRVRLGPFNDKAMADATREQLDVNGVEAALVRIQK